MTGPYQPDEEHVGVTIEEEVECLGTVVQCLGASLMSLRGEAEGEHELSLHDTREFLTLIQNLVESNLDPTRLSVLLLNDANTPLPALYQYAAADVAELTPCYANRETFTEAGFSNVKAQAIHLVGRIITVLTEHVDNGGVLFDLLTSSGWVDLLLGMLSHADEEENAHLRTAASECLFLFISKVKGAKEAVVRLRAVHFFFDLLWKERSKMVRNYVCAMLRVVAEEFSEQVLDVSLVVKAVTHLQHEESKHVAIMLFDIITLTFKNYHVFYLQRVHAVKEVTAALAKLCEAVLHRNVQGDVTSSITSLMKVIFSIEGVDRERTDFIKHVLQTDCWKALLALHHGEEEWSDKTLACALMKLKVFRSLVENCTTEATITLLNAEIAGFPALISYFLNKPLDESCPKQYRQELVLSFLIWLCKSPEAREFIRTSVRQYSSWGESLRLKLSDIVSQIEPSAFEDIYVVDCHSTYINNPASETGIDFSDMAMVFTAVRRLIRDQEAGTPSAERYVEPPARSAKARMFEAIDARAPLKIGQRKQRLTCALLNYTVARTFETPEQAAVTQTRHVESMVEDIEASSPKSVDGGMLASPRMSPPTHYHHHNHHHAPRSISPPSIALPTPEVSQVFKTPRNKKVFVTEYAGNTEAVPALNAPSGPFLPEFQSVAPTPAAAPPPPPSVPRTAPHMISQPVNQPADPLSDRPVWPPWPPPGMEEGVGGGGGGGVEWTPGGGGGGGGSGAWSHLSMDPQVSDVTRHPILKRAPAGPSVTPKRARSQQKRWR